MPQQVERFKFEPQWKVASLREITWNYIYCHTFLSFVKSINLTRLLCLIIHQSIMYAFLYLHNKVLIPPTTGMSESTSGLRDGKGLPQIDTARQNTTILLLSFWRPVICLSQVFWNIRHRIRIAYRIQTSGRGMWNKKAIMKCILVFWFSEVSVIDSLFRSRMTPTANIILNPQQSLACLVQLNAKAHLCPNNNLSLQAQDLWTMILHSGWG
jgi:hypothetical protein